MRDIKRLRGFTLLEVIVVVAIVGILTAVAVPSFSTVFNGSRLSTQANELVVAIQTARSEAVRSNRPVRVCGVAAQGGTTCNSGTGYWVVLGTDASGATTLIREFAIKAPAVITVGANLADGIIFGPDGIARKADGSLSNGDIVVCIPTRHPKENKRRVSIASGLRVNVSATGNGDGSC